MRQVLVVVISAVLVIGQLSCEDDNVESNSAYKEALSDVFEASIPDTASVNKVFNIYMKHYGSNGCSEFSRIGKTVNDDTLNVLVYQKTDESLICTQAIIIINSPISHSFQKRGKKYIRFNESNQLIDSLYVK